ncbi:hypothetical protein ABTW72_01535 [Micromonospora sp. NPDC127501]|uniref:hypothetical protein n=1 Tax=Micromonospora sp. NPDC127501 TaxID=3154872 RepID=UPI00332CE842
MTALDAGPDVGDGLPANSRRQDRSAPCMAWANAQDRYDNHYVDSPLWAGRRG